jgi:uncharacterized damage-inducible protein DinB
MNDVRYPIGPETTATPVAESIRILERAPARLREAVRGLDDAQLDTPYRPDGWTVRQVVHHLADSHMHACVRVRLALAEDAPEVKVYDERTWAELSDARTMPIAASLDLFEGLHKRLVTLLRSLTPSEWQRVYRHSERGPVRLDQAASLYAWHARHHTAQIAGLRERMGWK